jgi:tetratricopeptide (TPR) repeat protein
MSVGTALTLPPELRARFERMGLEFLAEILGRSSARHPNDAERLAELGTLLTRLGRLEEGLAADQRLVRLIPGDSTAHYNLACSLALLGRADEALDELERSIELGYDDLEHLQSDEDLASLRGSTRFRSFVERLEERA